MSQKKIWLLGMLAFGWFITLAALLLFAGCDTDKLFSVPDGGVGLADATIGTSVIMDYGTLADAASPLDAAYMPPPFADAGVVKSACGDGPKAGKTLAVIRYEDDATCWFLIPGPSPDQIDALCEDNGNMTTWCALLGDDLNAEQGWMIDLTTIPCCVLP